MLRTDDNLQVELLGHAITLIEKQFVHVDTVDFDTQRGTIDIRLVLPRDADRSVRHGVLEVLANFEHDLDHTVTTNPVFVWDNEA